MIQKIIIDTDPVMGIKVGDSENGNHLQANFQLQFHWSWNFLVQLEHELNFNFSSISTSTLKSNWSWNWMFATEIEIDEKNIELKGLSPFSPGKPHRTLLGLLK